MSPSHPHVRAVEGSRFAQVTPDNHSAWIWLPTLIALCYSFCFLGFRLVIKRRRYSADDYTLGGAYVFALVHWITTFVALDAGIGQSSRILSQDQLLRAAKLSFAGRTPYIIALCLAKCSVVLLIRHVFTRDLVTAWRACNVALCIALAWGVASAFALSSGCSTKLILGPDPASACSNMKSRVIAIAVFDCLSEVGVFLMLCVLILPLHIKRVSKLLVLIAFSFRLPNVIFASVCAIVYISRLPDNDPCLSIAIPGAWSESLLAYSLMSTTIPCLKSFMKNFQTGGLGFTPTSIYAGASGSGGTGNTSHHHTTSHKPTPVESHQLKDIARSISSNTPLNDDGYSRRSGSFLDLEADAIRRHRD